MSGRSKARRTAVSIAWASAIVGGLAATRFAVGDESLRSALKLVSVGFLLGTVAAVGLGLRASALARRLRGSGGRFIFGEFVAVLLTCLAAAGGLFMIVAAVTMPTWRDAAVVLGATLAAFFIGRTVGAFVGVRLYSAD